MPLSVSLADLYEIWYVLFCQAYRIPLLTIILYNSLEGLDACEDAKGEVWSCAFSLCLTKRRRELHARVSHGGHYLSRGAAKCKYVKPTCFVNTKLSARKGKSFSISFSSPLFMYTHHFSSVGPPSRISYFGLLFL